MIFSDYLANLRGNTDYILLCCRTKKYAPLSLLFLFWGGGGRNLGFWKGTSLLPLDEILAHLKVCFAISVSVDFIQSVPTIKPLITIAHSLHMHDIHSSYKNLQ